MKKLANIFVSLATEGTVEQLVTDIMDEDGYLYCELNRSHHGHDYVEFDGCWIAIEVSEDDYPRLISGTSQFESGRLTFDYDWVAIKDEKIEQNGKHYVLYCVSAS